MGKLTEEHRRDRVRRADAGDETAELKFKRQTAVQPSVGRANGEASQGSSYGQKRPYAPGPSSYSGPTKSSRQEYSSSRGDDRSLGVCRLWEASGTCRYG